MESKKVKFAVDEKYLCRWVELDASDRFMEIGCNSMIDELEVMGGDKDFWLHSRIDMATCRRDGICHGQKASG